MYQATELSTLDDVDPVFLLKARANYTAVQAKQSGPAQDEKYARQFRRALAGRGYGTVKAEFAAQFPVMSWSDPLRSVSWNGRSPSMEFVKDWLVSEENAQRSVRRLLYWGSLVATVATVLAIIWGAS
jgi:hypothetical protein